MSAQGARRWLRLALLVIGNALVFLMLPELRRLSTDEARSLFIQPGGPGFAYAAFHYNEKGNRFVAEVLYRRLMAYPTVTRALDDPEAG